MTLYHKKTHRDAIWVYHQHTIDIQRRINQEIEQAGFAPVSLSKEWKYCQYGLPVVWQRGDQIISWRVEDSLFMEDPEAWTRPKPNAIISDNITLKPIAGHHLSLYPEHMHVYYFDYPYEEREPRWAFNCFMNRISGDRSIVFYELLRRKLLDTGLVSFNCFRPGDNRSEFDLTDYTEKNYDWQYESADLVKYSVEHEQGRQLIPYNNFEDQDLSLEECILDSKISLVLETYISDDHIVFSEKIFRCMQLPRPWLLYCTPSTITRLREYGFDVLDDYVDHSYDNEPMHFARLYMIIEELQRAIEREYSPEDYSRFAQAAAHNQELLRKYRQDWPKKFDEILEQIKTL